MNYQKRIAVLRELLRQRGLEGVFVTLDANMEYLTGIPRLSTGNTKQRQNSSEYGCMLVTADRVTVFIAALNYIVTMAKLGERKVDAEFVVYEDGDLTGRALVAALESRNLTGKPFGVTQDITAALTLKLLTDCKLQLADVNDIIFAMRSIKDEDELTILREASVITDNIYKALLQRITIGTSTEEVERELDKMIVEFGGSKCSFEGEINTHGPKAGPMVGFSHEVVEQGDVLGVDFGIMYKGYCTDFGRTIFVGEPTKEHIHIFDTVKKAQDAAIEAMVSGHGTGDLADSSARAIIANAGYGDRFIHKLGHSIGMDVHECPFLAKGEIAPLKAGMIFAVEPSIFIPHDCFIRLEDMVLVTENGTEIMSKLPRAYDVLA